MSNVKVGDEVKYIVEYHGEIVAIRDGKAIVEYQDGSRNEISLELIESFMTEVDLDGLSAEEIEALTTNRTSNGEVH